MILVVIKLFEGMKKLLPLVSNDSLSSSQVPNYSESNFSFSNLENSNTNSVLNQLENIFLQLEGVDQVIERTFETNHPYERGK